MRCTPMRSCSEGAPIDVEDKDYAELISLRYLKILVHLRGRR